LFPSLDAAAIPEHVRVAEIDRTERQSPASGCLGNGTLVPRGAYYVFDVTLTIDARQATLT
jgi:hypothetical protein